MTLRADGADGHARSSQRPPGSEIADQRLEANVDRLEANIDRLTEVQKVTELKLQAFIDSLNKGRNGHE